MHLTSCRYAYVSWLAYGLCRAVGHAMCRALRSRHCHALHVIPFKPHALNLPVHALVSPILILKISIYASIFLFAKKLLLIVIQPINAVLYKLTRVTINLMMFKKTKISTAIYIACFLNIPDDHFQFSPPQGLDIVIPDNNFLLRSTYSMNMEAFCYTSFKQLCNSSKNMEAFCYTSFKQLCNSSKNYKNIAGSYKYNSVELADIDVAPCSWLDLGIVTKKGESIDRQDANELNKRITEMM